MNVEFAVLGNTGTKDEYWGFAVKDFFFYHSSTGLFLLVFKQSRNWLEIKRYVLN